MCSYFTGLGGHPTLASTSGWTQSHWRAQGSPSGNAASGVGSAGSSQLTLVRWHPHQPPTMGLTCGVLLADEGVYHPCCSMEYIFFLESFHWKLAYGPLGRWFLPCSSGIFLWSKSVHFSPFINCDTANVHGITEDYWGAPAYLCVLSPSKVLV